MYGDHRVLILHAETPIVVKRNAAGRHAHCRMIEHVHAISLILRALPLHLERSLVTTMRRRSRCCRQLTAGAC